MWSVPLPSAPAPRPLIVDACAALAGLGFGAVLAAVILGESRGSARVTGVPGPRPGWWAAGRERLAFPGAVRP
jgi:hypothetical protein